jgi:hypothetical protein
MGEGTWHSMLSGKKPSPQRKDYSKKIYEVTGTAIQKHDSRIDPTGCVL